MKYWRWTVLTAGYLWLQGALWAADTTTANPVTTTATATATAPAVAAKGPAPWPLPANEYFLGKIPPPPATGSTGDQTDLAYSIQAQAVAAPAQIKEATDIAVNLSVFSFAEVLGANFTKAKYPLTAAFCKRLDATVNVPKNFIKEHYARVRPYLAHPEQVKQLVPVDAGYSYPSGHVARAQATALVLAYLDPAKTDVLQGFVEQVAQARIIGGMHYQSDTVASKQLGKLVMEQLMKEPDFIEALDELKAKEWAQAPVEMAGAR